MEICKILNLKYRPSDSDDELPFLQHRARKCSEHGRKRLSRGRREYGLICVQIESKSLSDVRLTFLHISCRCSPRPRPFHSLFCSGFAQISRGCIQYTDHKYARFPCLSVCEEKEALLHESIRTCDNSIDPDKLQTHAPATHSSISNRLRLGLCLTCSKQEQET